MFLLGFTHVLRTNRVETEAKTEHRGTVAVVVVLPWRRDREGKRASGRRQRKGKDDKVARWKQKKNRFGVKPPKCRKQDQSSNQNYVRYSFKCALFHQFGRKNARINKNAICYFSLSVVALVFPSNLLSLLGGGARCLNLVFERPPTAPPRSGRRGGGYTKTTQGNSSALLHVHT